MVSVEPMVLIELRLRLSLSSLESSWDESLDEVVDGCALGSLLVAEASAGGALGSMLVAAMMAVVAPGTSVVTTSGFTSVVTWLGRYWSSGMSTNDSVSLSGVSANAANGLAVLIDDVVAAVGVTTFGVSSITPVVGRVVF